VVYLYPTVDPAGNAITMSASILIPQEIWDGQRKSDGIVLYNHYTLFNRKEAPSLLNGEIERILLTCPLDLNYIIVESDFYGFGATVRYPQAFLQGSCNSRPTLDALLAARELLASMHIDYGPLCFNLGYSSGGYDAIETAKIRDMEYSKQITFDKTFAGGGPCDIAEAYRQYVIIDSTAYNAVPLLLMVSTNETQKLNYSYDELFQPEVSKKVGPLVLSKDYSSWAVCDSIGREKKVHEILADKYCDLESDEAKTILSVFENFKNTKDWIPDTKQRIYIFHSRDDDYVPVASARPVIRFLKANGFTPSIIPGKTNLQTNFFCKKLGHLSGTAIYLIQTLAAIKAWPYMYVNNELRSEYAALLNYSFNIRLFVSQLQAYGIDVVPLINQIVAYVNQKTGMDLTKLTPEMAQNIMFKLLQPLGVTPEEMTEIMEDSNIDIAAFINDIVAFLNEIKPAKREVVQNDGNKAPSAVRADQTDMLIDNAKLQKVLEKNRLPVTMYEKQMYDWFTTQE